MLPCEPCQTTFNRGGRHSALMTPLRITGHSIACPAGIGERELAAALREGSSGLRPNDFGESPLPTWIGRVPGLEASRTAGRLAEWDCRNNRLAWRGAACGRLSRGGARRPASAMAPTASRVVVGTSTSSIGASEEAYRGSMPDGRYPADLRRPIIHTPHSLGDFVQHALGSTGVSVTVATACSSSAKVFAQAERLIRTGLADAAIVGGVDYAVRQRAVRLQLAGAGVARALPAVRSSSAAASISAKRRASRCSSATATRGPWLLGLRRIERCASHVDAASRRSRRAAGARRMRSTRAALTPDDIDYINLHGTASQKNDEVEARLVADLFPARDAAPARPRAGPATRSARPASSKPRSALLALEHGLLPGTLNAQTLDPACGPQIQRDNDPREVRSRVELLVRLRRQQLRAAVRRGAAHERARHAR